MSWLKCWYPDAFRAALPNTQPMPGASMVGARRRIQREREAAHLVAHSLMDDRVRFFSHLHATPEILGDPDGRSMATSGRGTGIVGFNVQIAVDLEHYLVVAHDVANEGHDRTQLVSMGCKTQKAIGTKEVTVVADPGYGNGEEVLAREGTGILPVMPRADTSGHTKKGLFVRADFVYDPVADRYVCPAGAMLTKPRSVRTATATSIITAISTPAMSARWESGARPKR